MQHIIAQSFTPPPCKQRNVALDWLSGIMMIKIIIMHAIMYYSIPWLNETALIMDIVLFMYMPWFFFKAGMYVKAQPLRETLPNAYSRLMVPWIIFGVLALIILSPVTIGTFDSITEWSEWVFQTTVADMAMPGNAALWFLISLFACRLIASIVPLSHMTWAYATAIIGFIAALLFHAKPPQLWDKLLMFPNIFMAVFFYASGYILHKKQYDRRVAISAAVVFMLLTILDSQRADMRTNGGMIDSPIAYSLFYPRALSAIVVINYLAHRLPTSYLKKSILSYIGRNSMAFYVIHMPLMLSCKIVLLHATDLSSSTQLIIMLATVTISLPVADILLRRYWPEALGLKRDRKSMTAPDELP